MLAVVSDKDPLYVKPYAAFAFRVVNIEGPCGRHIEQARIFNHALSPEM